MESHRLSMLTRSAILAGVTLGGVLGTATGATAQALKDVQTADTPLVLKAQGSFFVGGEKAEQTQVETGGLGPGGHITVNQMYVRYMVPQTGAGKRAWGLGACGEPAGLAAIQRRGGLAELPLRVEA